jgi:hypothetical protein
LIASLTNKRNEDLASKQTEEDLLLQVRARAQKL